jgi:hypothetical protein
MRRLHDLVTNATRRRLHESEVDDDKAGADLVAEMNDYRVQKAKKEAAKKEAGKKKEAAVEKADDDKAAADLVAEMNDYRVQLPKRRPVRKRRLPWRRRMMTRLQLTWWLK